MRRPGRADRASSHSLTTTSRRRNARPRGLVANGSQVSVLRPVGVNHSEAASEARLIFSWALTWRVVC